MKGHFLIVFMVLMSTIAMLAMMLWQCMHRRGRKLLMFCSGIAVTVAATGILGLYGQNFSYLADGILKGTLFYGSLASLIWMFMFLLALPFLLVGAIASLGELIAERFVPAPVEANHAVISRRKFLRRTATVIPAAALAASSVGIIGGERSLDTTYHSLRYSNLPEYLEGYRIGQLSDLHMGLFFSPERLEESIDALVVAKADRLVITGDLIDELSLLPQCEQILQAAAEKFPDGIDFIYGNHEYYRGLAQITAMLERTPVRILRNSNYEAGAGAQPFYIAGVDYSFARDDALFDEQREAYTQQALAGIPDGAFVVLLAHHSQFIDEGLRHAIPLTLTGHTHGGQFWPFGQLHEFGFKYWRGMFSKGEARGYVHRGTGHWLPFRLGCSREAAVFELHKG
jgi:predicted MPP superfamily phosphohydrolase